MNTCGQRVASGIKEKIVEAKACVLHSEKDLRIENVPLAEMGDDQVLVRIGAGGLRLDGPRRETHYRLYLDSTAAGLPVWICRQNRFPEKYSDTRRN
jgi:hypothetical protein